MSAIEQIEIEQLKDARESISWWNRRYNALNKCNNEKKDRICKAIKCIEYYAIENEDYSKSYNEEEQNLLNILKGESNE